MIIPVYTFFFSKKMVYKSSMSVFIANTLNFIMKSAIYFFSCLNILIFYSVSASLLLSLNMVLISHANLSQSWVSFSLSSSLSFFWTYISAILSLVMRQFGPKDSLEAVIYFSLNFIYFFGIFIFDLSYCFFCFFSDNEEDIWLGHITNDVIGLNSDGKD